MKTTIDLNTRVLNLLILLLGLSSTPVFAFVDIFAEISGIPGESIDDTHTDWIDILSASGNFSSKSCGEFKMSKFLDTATPALIASTVTGLVHPTITVEFRRAGKEFVNLRLEFTNATITNIATTDEAGAEKATEVVTINAESITVEYTPSDKSGNPGNPVTETVTCNKK